MILKSFDVFSGIGMLSKGLELEGYEIAGGLDIDEDAISSFQENFPRSKAILGSITDKRIVKRFINAMRKAGANIGVGGAPCQAYSMAGNRDPLERKAYFFLDFFRVIGALQPLAFIFENVAGLRSMKIIDPQMVDLGTGMMKDSSLQKNLEEARRYKDLKRYASQRRLNDLEREEFDALALEISSIKQVIENSLVDLLPVINDQALAAGYDVFHHVLDAKWYRSAQSRKRIFVVGLRHDLGIKMFSFPHGACFCHDCGQEASLTLDGKCDKNGFHDLKFITAKECIGDLEDKPENYLPHHVFTRHAPAFIERLHEVKEGETLYKNYSDAWYRLRADAPARTMKEDHGAMAIMYPPFDRVITPREMMRFQGIPDKGFVVHGRKSKIIKLVGNGVDIHLGRAIARAVKEALEEVS